MTKEMKSFGPSIPAAAGSPATSRFRRSHFAWRQAFSSLKLLIARPLPAAAGRMAAERLRVQECDPLKIFPR